MLAPLLLMSCNAGDLLHDQYKRASAERVKVGMTSAQVLSIMGRPSDASTHDGVTTWIWELDSSVANARSFFFTVDEYFAVHFDTNGRVTYSKIDKFVDTD